MFFRFLWPALVLLLSAGCTSAISREVRSQVDPSLTFKAVFHDPDSHKGKAVLWGGEIIRVRNTKDETWIELLQRPLSGNDRPIRESVSEGRFLIRHEGFLDPAVYGMGREITVAGEVQGRQTQALDDVEYSYPLIADKELVLWGPRQEPTFHFGLGLGAVFSR
jgi:outer membrane lipoprotein